MKKPLKIRRYLLHFSSHSIPQVFTDTLVLGTGVAGMRAALAAAQGGSALLVSKKSISDGSTWEAQGGIAAAVGPEDSPEAHLEDTREAGCGLCDEESAGIMTREGPEVVDELLDWGMDFDRDEEGG
ncbi:MAG: FAD-binding protein, partial [Planctomycetota bacterium]